MSSTKQAIEGTRKNMFARLPETLLIVGYDKIPEIKEPKAHHLYQTHGRYFRDETLIASIKKHGVIEPVVVTRDGDNVYVVDGRRRVLNARWANEDLIKAGEKPIQVNVIVRDGEDASLMGIMVATNAIRLDETPLEKARKAKRMIDRGSSYADVGVDFGVGVAAIEDWMKLLSCNAEVLKKVESNVIAASVAIALSSLPKESQLDELEKLIAEGRATVGEARVAAKNVRAKKSASSDGKEAKETVVAPGKREMASVVQVLQDRLESEKLSAAETAEIEATIRTLQWVRGEGRATVTIANALRRSKSK